MDINKTMRQTVKEIDMNIAYKWYLRYQINEPIPHFSTFGKNYSRRFKDSNIFETIFSKIFNEVISFKFFDNTSVFIDGTHIKACANNKKSKNELVEKTAKFYQAELQKKIEMDIRTIKVILEYVKIVCILLNALKTRTQLK